MSNLATDFVTIDLGIGASGYARWHNATMEQVGLIRSRPKTKGLTARIDEQRRAWNAIRAAWYRQPDFIVIERMKHYPRSGRARKGTPYIDPQDLINLSLVSSIFDGPKYFVFASEWKGTIDRDTEQSRSAAALGPAELQRVEAVLPASLRKEAWSAVGIGLSLTKRCHLGFTLEQLV